MTNITCKNISGQYDGKIAYDIFVCEIFWILIIISLKFVFKYLIYMKSALVQVTGKVWQGHLFANIDKENYMKSTNDKSFLR